MRKTFRSFLIACALTAFASQTVAQVSLDATTGVRSKYTLSYNGAVVYDDPLTQGDLWWTLPFGLWADVWYSTDFRLRKNYGREIDYGAGWAGDNVKAGFYYFDLAQQFSQKPIGDAVDIFITFSMPLSVDAHRISLFVEMNYLFATKSPAENNGAFPNAGIEHSWKILNMLDFAQDAALIYDGSVFGSDRGFVGRYQASLATHPADWLTIRAPHFRVHKPLSKSIKDRETEPVVGLDVIIHHTFMEAKQ